jgi:monovalent cation:H+ antiporter, CPA1 family
MHHDIYFLTSLFLGITVAIAYINHQFFKLPTSVGIMLGAITISIVVMLAKAFGANQISSFASNIMNDINFNKLLINWLLSFLLFAGSMTIDFNTLKSQALLIGTITLLGVVISTFLLGILTYFSLSLLNLKISLIECFVFGALISPTDPIAVLATFKKLGASKKTRVIVAGESLFNDGVGIVLFFTLSQFAFHHTPITALNIGRLFCQQALGGIFYGALLGYIANFLIKKSKDPLISILITLTLTTAGYGFARAIGISGPLAMVMAGILIGNHGKKDALEDKINQTLDIFWEVIDEVLNAILFLLLGLEILTITGNYKIYCAALIAIPLSLLTRLISVSIPLRLIKKRSKSIPNIISILTWGGLKGGLAVALALSLKQYHLTHFNILICMTFAIVTFSIIIQGTTVQRTLPKTQDKL